MISPNETSEVFRTSKVFLFATALVYGSVIPATPGGPPAHCAGHGQAGIQYDSQIPIFMGVTMPRSLGSYLMPLYKTYLPSVRR